MKKIILFITFIIFICNGFSTNTLDSLSYNLQQSEKSLRFEILYNFNTRNDSISNSVEFIQIALNNCEDIEDIIFFKIQKALIFSKNYYFSKSYTLLDSCIILAKQNNLDSLLGLAYFKKGEVYISENNYADAISNFYNALNSYELSNDTNNLMNCYNNIAMSYISLNDTINHRKAIQILNKSWQIIRNNPNLIKNYFDIFNNLGVAYDGLGENEKALSFYIKYYENALEQNNVISIILSTLNIGDSYRILKNYSKAEEFTNRCLMLAKQNNILNYYYFASANLAEIYNEIGECEKSISILEDIKTGLLNLNDNPLSQFYLRLLSQVYYNLGNYKESANTYKYYTMFNDSVFSIETKMKISEFEAKYENEKKEQKILLLEKNDEISQAQIKRETFMRNSFIIGFLLMILLAFSIFKAYRIKQNDNKILQLKNNEIFQQKEEIQAQAENLETANTEITIQKEKIEVIHSELTKSIYYARRIQQAILPSIENFCYIFENNKLITNKQSDNFFILYKPKDIVSGDFYWIAQRENIILVAVADCTGHGVPGAFMSMLGISFLNEIIARKEITAASQVLDELRKYVINSLQQRNFFNENSDILQDGMDISFVAIDNEKRIIQFAGANNPLWLVRSNANLTGFENLLDLEEIKGDKMPIGVYIKMENFSNHIIIYNAGDLIYLRSDGYDDQFGGPRGKKFMSKNLSQLILNNSEKSMNEQKEILSDTLEKWKNDFGEIYEQTDDITIIGIKLT